MSGQPAVYLLKSLIVVLVLTIITDRRIIYAHDCQVFVDEPWPVPHIFVPRESTVEINCIAGESSRSYTPFWAIDLANDTKRSFLEFTDRNNEEERLNSQSVYQLPQIETPGMPPTLRLLINDTVRNNQTRIQCDRSATSESITTLFVIDPIIILLTGDTMDNGINLSWNRQSQGLDDAALNFLLTISHGSSSDNVSLDESYYHFTAPVGAPPCEIYNFSVTATYVGATYTGAGCSVPSNAIETMLPSLPNIARLESSLVYSLVQISKQFILNISFEPVDYNCDQFPPLNYTLELRGPLPDMTVQSLPVPTLGENFIVENVSNDSAFSFIILVSNTVGVVSTKSRGFYTTDIQVIMATLMEGVNASIIQCEFITGSTANGCMVVLTGFEAFNITLTRNVSTNSATTTVSLEHPPSCYTGVEAFDIESDGSVGSLAVPGQLENRSETPCIIAVTVVNETLPAKPKASDSVPITVIVVVVVIITLLFLLSLLAGIVTMLVLKRKRAQGSENKQKHSSPDYVTEDAPKGEVATTAKGESLYYSEVVPSNKRKKRASTISADVKVDNAYSEPTGASTKGYTSLLLAGEQGDTGAPSQEALYDQPIPVKVKTPAGRADNNRNNSSTANCESTHATQDTHLYYTLEQGRATDRINSTPTSLAPSNISDPPQPASNECPPPVYQEITDLKTRGQATASTVSGADSSPNTPLPSSSPPLIQRPLSVAAADSDTQNPVG